jgi:hypothetical protein
MDDDEQGEGKAEEEGNCLSDEAHALLIAREPFLVMFYCW